MSHTAAVPIITKRPTMTTEKALISKGYAALFHAHTVNT
jgi:hypothetical protein